MRLARPGTQAGPASGVREARAAAAAAAQARATTFPGRVFAGCPREANAPSEKSIRRVVFVVTAGHARRFGASAPRT